MSKAETKNDTVDVDVEITGMKVRASRTLPVYNENGSPVSYSSDVTDHEIVVGCTLPMTIETPAAMTDTDRVVAVIEFLSSMLSERVTVAAEIKAMAGAKLPQPVKLDYGAVSSKKRVEGI